MAGNVLARNEIAALRSQCQVTPKVSVGKGCQPEHRRPLAIHRGTGVGERGVCYHGRGSKERSFDRLRTSGQVDQYHTLIGAGSDFVAGYGRRSGFDSHWRRDSGHRRWRQPLYRSAAGAAGHSTVGSGYRPGAGRVAGGCPRGLRGWHRGAHGRNRKGARSTVLPCPAGHRGLYWREGHGAHLQRNRREQLGGTVDSGGAGGSPRWWMPTAWAEPSPSSR